MISFNPTALTQPTPLIQRKAKTRQFFPRKTFQNFTQLSFATSIFTKKVASLRFKLIFFNRGTKTFQAESHGRHDHDIPYRGR